MLRVVDFFLLSRSFAEALYRGLIGIMLGNELLHPDHIVPPNLYAHAWNSPTVT